MAQSLSPPITLTVYKTINRAPVWAPGLALDLTSGVPKKWNLTFAATDPEGDPVTMGVHIMPDELRAHGLSFNPETKELIYDGTPFDELQPGDAPKVWELIFWASDGKAWAETAAVRA